MSATYNTSNYFAFYELPISFMLEQKELKRKFYSYSRTLHPDFHTQESELAQDEVLLLATYNNKAYKTLAKLDSRIKYVLELLNFMKENEKHALPPMFLMEMMELNEQLMELQFEPDSSKVRSIEQEVNNIDKQLLTAITPILTNYNTADNNSQTDLEKIKNYYYKRRYLLRIKESLSKFAA